MMEPTQSPAILLILEQHGPHGFKRFLGLNREKKKNSFFQHTLTILPISIQIIIHIGAKTKTQVAPQTNSGTDMRTKTDDKFINAFSLNLKS
jgi:hypothetical protein